MERADRYSILYPLLAIWLYSATIPGCVARAMAESPKNAAAWPRTSEVVMVPSMSGEEAHGRGEVVKESVGGQSLSTSNRLHRID